MNKIKLFESFFELDGFLKDLKSNCFEEIPNSIIEYSINSEIYHLKMKIFWKDKKIGQKYCEFLIGEIKKLPDFDGASYLPHCRDHIDDPMKFEINLNKYEVIDMMKRDSKLALETSIKC